MIVSTTNTMGADKVIDKPQKPELYAVGNGMVSTAKQTKKEKTMTKKKKEVELTLKQLKAAAKDINTVVEPEPAIVLKGADEESLTASIKEAGEIIYETDELKKATWKVLEALGIKAQSVENEDTSEEEEQEEEQQEEAEIEQEEEQEEKAPAKKKGKGKKTSEKKAPKKDKKKAAPKKAAKKETKPKKADKKISAKKNTKKSGNKMDYTRSHALIDALKKGGTRQEIVERSNGMFMKKGGKDNMNVANYMFGYVIPSLLILGQVEKDGNTFIWIK